MLITENPQPVPDDNHPFCCSETLSQLTKSSNVCRDDDGNVERPDLSSSNSGLDDISPLPNFSIRDYVVNARGKDVAKHWPFSSCNLQVCLNHGTKDVLPPFDSLTKPSKSTLSKCTSTDVIKLSEKPEPSNKIETNSHMASKVCPVCKAFSSSSNTTLNAHIDQCLSGESTIKWTAADLKKKKDRMMNRPKKMRPLADVYARALQCTLEDLDRRNGTNWASNFDINLVLQEDKNNEGIVYFDSNGTKLRILSKFGDKGDRTAVETDERIKSLSIKKKNCLVNQSKAVKSREREFLPEEDMDEQSQPSSSRPCARRKSDDFGKIKQWVGSKRTSLKKKKINLYREKWHPDKIVVSDKFMKTKCNLNFTRKESLSRKSNDVYIEHRSCPRKRDGFSSFASQDHRRKENHEVPSKCNVESRKDGILIRKRSYSDSSNGTKTECHPYSWSSKKMKSPSPSGTGDSSAVGSRISHHDFGKKKTVSDCSTKSQGTKCTTSLRKNKLHFKKYHGLRSDDRVEENVARMEISKMCNSALEGNVPTETSNVADVIKEDKIGDGFASELTFGASVNASEEYCLDNLVPVDNEKENHCMDKGDASEKENHCTDKGDASEAQGSYFVDPIPIPGPPGSFLPSPGRMSSEEVQGNSSLTTCRLLSSEDDHDFVDMDTSDSPVSATSFLPTNGANQNTPPCCCSRKEGVIRNSYLNNRSDDKLYGSNLRLETIVPPELPCPYPTSSVLRLMGKNLMVVNRDEDRSLKIEPTESSRGNSQASPRLFSDSLNYMFPQGVNISSPEACADFRTVPELYPYSRLHMGLEMVAHSANACQAKGVNENSVGDAGRGLNLATALLPYNGFFSSKNLS